MVKRKKLQNKIENLIEQEENLMILLTHYISIIKESKIKQITKNKIVKDLRHITLETKKHSKVLNKIK